MAVFLHLPKSEGNPFLDKGAGSILLLETAYEKQAARELIESQRFPDLEIRDDKYLGLFPERVHMGEQRILIERRATEIATEQSSQTL